MSRELSQEERVKSIVLLLKDTIRNTEAVPEQANLPIWPLVQALDLIFQGIGEPAMPITDEQERQLASDLLKTGWDFTPTFDKERWEEMLGGRRSLPDTAMHIFEDAAHEWRYSLHGANGEIQFTSEGYSTKSNAERGVVDCVKNVFAFAGLRWSAEEERELLEAVVYD